MGVVSVFLLFSLITLWPLEEQVSYMYFFLLTAIRRKKAMNQICFINIHFVCQCLSWWMESQYPVKRFESPELLWSLLKVLPENNKRPRFSLKAVY